MGRPKRALVVVRRPLDDEKAASGLRAAVGYAAVGIEVTVAIIASPPPAARERSLGPAVVRHLQTLRALAGRVVTFHSQADADVAALGALIGDGSFDAIVVW